MYSTIKESFIENVLKFLQCIRSLWQLTQWILSPSFRQSDQRSFRHYLRTNHSQAFSKSMLSYRQRQRLHLCDQNSMLCLKVNLTHMHQLMGTYDKYDESIITICWATNKIGLHINCQNELIQRILTFRYLTPMLSAWEPSRRQDF